MTNPSGRRRGRDDRARDDRGRDDRVHRARRQDEPGARHGPGAGRAVGSPRRAASSDGSRRRWAPLLAFGGRRILTPARAGGLLGLLAAGLLLRLVTGTPAFALERVDAPTLRWTSPDAIATAVATPLGTNVFAISSGPIEERLRGLPGVASASVRVALPASLEVQLTERVPILAWRIGDTTFLLDRDGVLFATVDPAAIGTIAVPAVTDARVGSPLTLTLGTTLDPVDLDVATRLASVTPADIGSSATHLAVRVDDNSGYVLRTPTGWTAVFGFYTTNVREADLIPSQVQLLRNLLPGREDRLERIVLADGTNGTYTLRATPKP